MISAGKIDWTNVDEVRERFAECREKTARTMGVIKVCFVYTMLTSLIPAVVLTFFTISHTAGKFGGFAYARLIGEKVSMGGDTGDDMVRDGVRKLVNSIPPTVLYLLAIWIIGVVSLVAFIAHFKKPHRFLRAFYIAVSVVSLGLVFVTDFNQFGCLMCMVYGLFGFAVEDVVLRRYETLDELSKEPGYPGFLDYMDYANHMKNTIANYADYRKKLEEKHDKDRSLGVEIQKAIGKEDFVPEVFEPGVMPELSVPATFDDYSRDRSRRSANNQDETDILLD